VILVDAGPFVAAASPGDRYRRPARVRRENGPLSRGFEPYPPRWCAQAASPPSQNTSAGIGTAVHRSTSLPPAPSQNAVSTVWAQPRANATWWVGQARTGVAMSGRYHT